MITSLFTWCRLFFHNYNRFRLKNAQRSDICLFSTLEFHIVVLSPLIHIVYFQNLARLWVRLPSFGKDMSHCRVFSHRLILVLRISSATFFYDPPTSRPLTQPKPSERWVPAFKSGAFSKCRYWTFFGRLSREICFSSLFTGPPLRLSKNSLAALLSSFHTVLSLFI